MKYLTLFLFFISFSYNVTANPTIKAGIAHPNNLGNNHKIVGDNLALSTFNSIKIINLNTGNQIKELFYLHQGAFFENNNIYTIVDAYYDNGTVLCTIDNFTNEIINSDTLRINEQSFHLSNNNGLTIDFDENSNLIFMYGYTIKNQVKEFYFVVWDASESRMIDSFKYDDTIKSIKVIDQNTFFVAKSDQVLRYNYVNNEIKVVKAIDFTFVERLNFVENEQLLSILDNTKELYFYDIHKNEFVDTIMTGGNFYDIEIKENTSVISYIDRASDVVIYDLASKKIIKKVKTDYIPTSALFYNDDNLIVYSRVAGRMDMYDLNSGELIRSLLHNTSTFDVMQISDDEKSMVYGGFITSTEFWLTVSNMESNKIINTSSLEIAEDLDYPTNIEFNESYTFLSHGKRLITWNYKNDSINNLYLGEIISDMCLNASKNELLVATQNGNIYTFDQKLNELIKYSISDDYEIISANYDDTGEKIYCLVHNTNLNENSLFELNIESGNTNISNDYSLPLTTDISGKRAHHKNYFYDKYSMFDINKKESKNIYADFDPVMQNIRLSKNGNYALYAYFENYNVDYFQLFQLNGNQEWAKPNYTYNSNSFYGELHVYKSDQRLEASNAVFGKDNQIIVGMRNGSIVYLDLQDTLNTSFREISQNGEALISEFYNYDDVLTIEVNPDINRQINYQITDISGNTIQKGTLPQGTSHEQINFFGHPKSSYFIMFHTETSKQIFKFIN